MVIVFGSINLDLVFRVPALPRPGETVAGPAYQCLPGGKGANQALAAARAGSVVVMAGAVGRDAFADLATAPLREAGVDLERLLACDAPTGCAAVCIDDAAENLIVVASGANALADQAGIEATLLGPGSVVVIQHEVPVPQSAALARRARAAGARVVWNAAPALPLDTATLACVDVLVVNRHEAETMASDLGVGGASPQQLACALSDRCGFDVVITCGAAGSVAANALTVCEVPALKVAAVDTTGAGDAFVGVFASALERGADRAEALSLASVASALTCLAVGAQSSLPIATQIQAARRRLAPLAVTNRASAPTGARRPGSAGPRPG